MNVTWDEWAVPTIVGEDDLDVVEGIGWAQATAVGGDVMELYGIARGTAASMWGPSFVDEDVLTAQLDLGATTDEWLAQQLPETLARVEAFCRGFNRACEADPGIGAARREVLPVGPRDVVGHIVRDLVRFNQIDAEQLAFSPETFFGVSAAGSNAWAVAGSRSTTGGAMLVVNPHMSWGLKYHRFFEMRTVSPGREFHGCTLIGVPWQSMGYGPEIGWAHTVNPIKNLVVFELANPDADGYDLDGGRRAFETRRHVIEVKDGEPVEVLARRTVHGPVVTAPDGTEVAIRIAGVLDNPAYHALESWWQLSLASTVEELFATHDRTWLPMFTIVAADSAGSIGALYCGTPPVRSDWAEATRRLDGSLSELLVDEVHSAHSMPRVVNPECGWVGNCNETPWLFTDPPLQEADWPTAIAPPVTEVHDLRSLVSRDFLASRATISPDEMLDLKYHKRAVMADIVLDDLLAVAKEEPSLAEAVEVLTRWDRTMNHDSAGYPLFLLWLILQAGSQRALGWVTFGPEPGTLPTGLRDVGTSVALLQGAAGLMGVLGLPLDSSIGQLVPVGHGADAVPGDGGSGLAGSLKCFEVIPTPTGQLAVGVADTWISRVQFAAGAAPTADSLLVYGNSTEPGLPAGPSQFALWAADRLR